MNNKGFKITLADKVISVSHNHEYVKQICSEYIVDNQTKADIEIRIEEEDIDYELEHVLNQGTHSRSYLESLAVCRKIAEALIEYNIVLMHGAVISLQNEGIIFLARSGVGKTTHVNNWKKAYPETEIINGDKPLIDINKQLAFGTPWCGKEFYNKNKSTKIKAFCILDRAEENSIEKIKFKEALNKLIEHTYFPRKEESIHIVMNCINKLQNIDCFHLHCNMEISSAEVAHNAIFKAERINTFSIHGKSMLPLLEEGKDTATLISIKEFEMNNELNIGDVILFNQNDKLILHRIIKIENGIYITRGDNCNISEYVSHNQIIAVMYGFTKNNKFTRCDDDEYQKYVQKVLKKKEISKKRLIYRNYYKKVKEFFSQKELHIYTNNQYLYNTGTSKTIIKQINENHQNLRKPDIRIVENGIVLPRKRFIENNRVRDKGGVIDDKGNYIEESKEYDFSGSYSFDETTVVKSQESVIYLGRGFPHYGVVMIDLLRRYYFRYSNEGKNLKVCFCGIGKNPGKFGNSNKKSWELLNAIGLSKQDVIDIRVPTQFKKVYIPEPGFEYNESYHDEFYLPYKSLYDKVNTKRFDKVYLSRGRMPQKKETGERIIEKFFLMNGYHVLYPDETSILEQVAILKGASIIASVEGTISHNILFCSPGTKQIIIRRDTRLEPRHFLFNELMKSPAIYIDCYFNFLPGFPRHYDIGPFCMIFNKNIRKFAKDNNYALPKLWFMNNIKVLLKYCALCIKQIQLEKNEKTVY